MTWLNWNYKCYVNKTDTILVTNKETTVIQSIQTKYQSITKKPNRSQGILSEKPCVAMKNCGMSGILSVSVTRNKHSKK